jgi:subtilase family serine protease
MRLVKWGLLALAAIVGLAGPSTAPAAPAGMLQLERSGNVFHMAVCGRGLGIGYARCFAHVVTDARGTILNGKPNATSGTPSGYGPTDLRSAYAVSVGTGLPGSGATIAIVDAYGYSNAEADLGVYRNQYGLGACTTQNGCFKKVSQSGTTSYPRDDTGWSQETALDLDMASAMCPSCKILLVEASSSSLANLATAENYAAKSGAAVISNSYGGSETGTSSYNSAYNHPGVAITVSTGDSGYGAAFPATSAYVVAVGGTHLVRASGTRGWSETAWTSAGSGCSSAYAQPSFQSGTSTGCPNRAEADVSAVADPNTGVAVYGPVSRTRSGWQVYGGTSVSAPLIGGIYALVHDVSGITYPASKLYTSTSSLNDVVSGSNGSCGTLTCNAGPGYDGPTGLGTPKGTTAF